MDNEFIYLTIEQVFALLEGIGKLKENPYFRDDIAENFMKEVYAKATEITVNSLNAGTNVLQKLRKNGDKIEISKSKFDYITRLTGIDVFDEETMRHFLAKVNKVNTLNQTEQTSIGRK